VHSARRAFLLSTGLEASVPIHFDDEAPRGHAYLALAKPLGPRWDWETSVEASKSVALGSGKLAPATVDIGTALFFRTTDWKRGVYPGLEVSSRIPLSGAGRPDLSLLPQILTKLSRRGHVALSVGVQVPVVNRTYDFRGRAFLIWEYGEGPPWEGC
jgi:hypothetical protein